MDVLNYLKNWKNYYRNIQNRNDWRNTQQRLKDEQYYDFLCETIEDIEKEIEKEGQKNMRCFRNQIEVWIRDRTYEIIDEMIKEQKKER